ncbi:MAG: beta-glucanase (GH16 family) [Flavobacteriaceae bacterium]
MPLINNRYQMNPFYFVIFFIFSISYCGQTQVYELIWSDEFEGNGAINSTNWHHQTLLPNGGSWYNGEVQHYTNREANSYVSNGILKLVAKREFFTDQGVTKQFTSARLNSKFAFTYGKVDVRAKLPSGVGTWPAIWSLGQNIIEPGNFWSNSNGTVFWPACGELDIMEHWGNNQDYVQSAIHSPSSFGDTFNKGGQFIQFASTGFHVYTMEWTSERIIFSVDGVVHYTYEPAFQDGDTWPFDTNQYLLLNVAILPEISPDFTESSMEVDYVRVYQEEVLGIDNNNLNVVSVYPNPMTDLLTVKVPLEFLGTQLEIYSMLNQKLLTMDIHSENFNVDVSGLGNGTYLLQIKNKNMIHSELLIK